jgi:hypothetical protein
MDGTETQASVVWPIDNAELHQRAPFPHELVELVKQVKLFPNWHMEIGDGQSYDGSSGLMLIVYSTVPDALDHSKMTTIGYPFVVPAEIRTRAGWIRYLWSVVMACLRHEAGENFWIGDERPFAPTHLPIAEGYEVGP